MSETLVERLLAHAKLSHSYNSDTSRVEDELDWEAAERIVKMAARIAELEARKGNFKMKTFGKLLIVPVDFRPFHDAPPDGVYDAPQRITKALEKAAAALPKHSPMKSIFPLMLRANEMLLFCELDDGST